MSWTRSIAILLAGAWIGATLASWATATRNFRAVDRILDPAFRPEFSRRIEGTDPVSARTNLRFLASELNRWMFRRWGHLQALLAVLLIPLLLAAAPAPGRRASLVLAAAILVLCLLLALGITPRIRSIGRSLDFVPRPFPPAHAEAGRSFGLLHGLYLALDLAKTGLLVALWAVLTRTPGRGAP